MESDGRLELFFSQSLDGFFFMMLDEPVRWDETVDKEAVLDYVFARQRVTKVNDAMLAQYGVRREQFLGFTPADLFRHDLAYGRRVWREFFDRGRLHIETDERRFDGTPIAIEGDDLCFYDDEGRITGHFGIQREVTERKRAEQTLRQYNQRLQPLHATHLGIPSIGSSSPSFNEAPLHSRCPTTSSRRPSARASKCRRVSGRHPARVSSTEELGAQYQELLERFPLQRARRLLRHRPPARSPDRGRLFDVARQLTCPERANVSSESKGRAACRLL